jgi:hypothetical protein
VGGKKLPQIKQRMKEELERCSPNKRERRRKERIKACVCRGKNIPEL